MGDGAENFIEQQEKEKQQQQAYQQALNRSGIKCLITWTDGIQDELWDWSPAARVQGIFSELHNTKKIGQEYFLVNNLPQYYDGEDNDDSIEQSGINKNSLHDLIKKLKTFAVGSQSEALCEVIILSKADKKLLGHEVVRQRKEAKSLKEEMIPSMFLEMISYMESEPRQDVYVFAREI
jgi:hypothetical protein